MNNIITQQEKDRIDTLCKQYNIKNYTISSDGIIDVVEHVNLCDKNLCDTLPLKFGKVSGDFDCSDNSLTTLEGCPKYVGGDFNCSSNQLTSLEHCPTSNGMDFYCYTNKLTSLKYCPSVVGHFDCCENNISSLEYCPTQCGESFVLPEYLPNEFYKEYFALRIDGDYHGDEFLNKGQRIFLQYQHYYDVWTPEFNEENMMGLIAEIKDGLR
jgi:hypothetical protein